MAETSFCTTTAMCSCLTLQKLDFLVGLEGSFNTCRIQTSFHISQLVFTKKFQCFNRGKHDFKRFLLKIDHHRSLSELLTSALLFYKNVSNNDVSLKFVSNNDTINI